MLVTDRTMLRAALKRSLRWDSTTTDRWWVGDDAVDLSSTQVGTSANFSEEKSSDRAIELSESASDTTIPGTVVETRARRRSKEEKGKSTKSTTQFHREDNPPQASDFDVPRMQDVSSVEVPPGVSSPRLVAPEARTKFRHDRGKAPMSSEEKTTATEGELGRCKKEMALLTDRLFFLQSQREGLHQDLQEAIVAKKSLELQLSSEQQQKHMISCERDTLATELNLLKEELASLKENDENQWLQKKRAFLSSPEFYDLLGARTCKMLKFGFEGAGKQFVRSGLIPKGSDLSFLNLEKVWDELQEEETKD